MTLICEKCGQHCQMISKDAFRCGCGTIKTSPNATASSENELIWVESINNRFSASGLGFTYEINDIGCGRNWACVIIAPFFRLRYSHLKSKEAALEYAQSHHAALLKIQKEAYEKGAMDGHNFAIERAIKVVNET